MRFSVAVLLFGLVAAMSAPVGAVAEGFETKAAQAFMVDAETGTVLFAKNPDDPVPPASLAKLMTMEVAFDAVKSGRRSMDDVFTVSENAWRTGGAPSGTATMFAALKSSIRLRDLIQGAIVQGANDACIIIAEGMAGSEQEFVKLMNARAKALGLEKSVFVNSSGLPAEGQVVTMRELVMLGEHIWRTYPDDYRIYSQSDFTWNKIFQRNRNPLLSMDIGADGMGTGYTEASGYAVLGAAEKNGRRIFAALGGLATDKERAEEAKKMFDWGMSAFRKSRLFPDGAVVGQVSLYGGAKGGIAVKARGPIDMLVPVEDPGRVQARIVYHGPVVAPVEEGARIGVLRVSMGDSLSQETPLYAAESVGIGSLHQRAADAIGELLVGWLR